MYKPLAATLMLTICCSQALAEDTVPVEQAKRDGIATCLEMVKAGTVSVIGEGNGHYSFSTSNTASPNQRMFNTQIVVNFLDGHGFTSLTVAPTATNKCDGTYTQVISLPKSCALLRKTTFSDWKDTTSDSPLTVLSGHGKRMVMMPFLTGCTLITTVVAYE